MSLADAVGWSSLAAGIACLVVALILAATSKEARKKTKDAVSGLADTTKATAQDAGKFAAQAGPLSTTLESVGKLAGALKDLDRVAQLLSISLGFFAVAGVVAGLEEVAESLAG